MLELKDLQIGKEYINNGTHGVTICKVIKINHPLVTLVMSNGKGHWDQSKWLSVIEYGKDYPKEIWSILFNNELEVNEYLSKLHEPTKSTKLSNLYFSLNESEEDLRDLRKILNNQKNKYEELKLVLERDFKEDELNTLVHINNLKIGTEYLEYSSDEKTFKKILVDFIYFIDNKTYIVNTSVARKDTYYLYFENSENIDSAKNYIDLDYAKIHINNYNLDIKQYTELVERGKLKIEKLKLDIENLEKEILV